jgi:hypothetical protein
MPAILDLMLSCSTSHSAPASPSSPHTTDPQASHITDAVYDISDGVLTPGQK